MILENLVLITASILTALHAGLLYAFSAAVIPALRNVKSSIHIEVFQTLNEEIENPIFFLSFFGPIVLLPIAAFLYRDLPQFPWIVAAVLVQFIFSDCVTTLVNIPLNKKLAKINLDRITEKEAEKIVKEYNGKGSRWMKFHHIRTIASIVATALVFIACLYR
jgi:uncharacterized membrane protein